MHESAKFDHLFWGSLDVDSSYIFVIWYVSHHNFSLQSLIEWTMGYLQGFLVVVSVFHSSNHAFAIQLVVILHQEIYQTCFDRRPVRLINSLFGYIL